MTLSIQGDCPALTHQPNVFVLHCGLDIKRVQRSCERLGLPVTLIPFRKEEVFAYYVRLDRPHPDLIIIRSHFRSLVERLNQQKNIPTIVVSTHLRPADCLYRFIQASQGYHGSDAFQVYEQLARSMQRQLCAG